MKDMDEWVEWMTLNPELAEKYHPELMNGLTERIKNSEPFRTALIIQKLPNHFPKWKTEIENFFGAKRAKMISQYIDLIKVVLIENKYAHEIEQVAVESVRAELTEQLEYWESQLIPSPPQQTETKIDKLKEQLRRYGFFELPKVRHLSEPTKQSLVELIGKNDLPYSIAMLDFLVFLKHLEKEYFKTKYKLNIEVAKWFDSDKDGRGVKGNISVLSDYSNENKSKFTAHLHKETVKIDYQNLK
jgi:hypothetical protein